MSMRLDDLWLASFLVAEGAKLKQVAVVPYNNGRLQAFFELEEIPAQILESYAQGDPKVGVHAFRQAVYQLREAMHAALAKRNGGNNHQKTNQPEKTNHQTRSVNHEQDSARDHRSD